MERIRREFNTLTIVMVPVAIAINIAVGQLVLVLKLPVYLDSIGTVLVGVLAGPWAGAVTGFLSSVIWTISGLYPPAIAFGGVAVIIGALAGAFGKVGWARVWWKVILAGLLTGLTAALLSAPIAAYVFGGVMGSGTDVLVAMFRSFGASVLPANFLQGAVSDPADKVVTYLIIWAILQALPIRFKGRFSNLGPSQG